MVEIKPHEFFSVGVGKEINPWKDIEIGTQMNNVKDYTIFLANHRQQNFHCGSVNITAIFQNRWKPLVPSGLPTGSHGRTRVVTSGCSCFIFDKGQL